MSKPIMDVSRFLELVRLALSKKTVYFYGGFGQKMVKSNIDLGCRMYPYNETRRAMYESYIGQEAYGFDCVNLVKGILWGWRGDTNKIHGGAIYGANDVPDWPADSFFNLCSGRSSDFTKIQPGDMLWIPGHFGVYMGDGLAAEATPVWKNSVQLTAVGNIGHKAGYPTRTWNAYGKCPFIAYNTVPAIEQPGAGGSGAGVPKIGDTVVFNGGDMYRSTDGVGAVKATPGAAKITAYVAGGKYPFHIVALPESQSNVYGWVSPNTFNVTNSIVGTKPKVGDIVEFTGTKQYVSSTATNSTAAKAGRAKVTHYIDGALHPYHIVAEAGGTAKVYGFVNATDIKRVSETPPVAVPAPEVPFSMVLQQGNSGDDVKILQYLVRTEPDGVFGPVTKAAVEKFQLAQGLIADGVVSDKTWAALRK